MGLVCRSAASRYLLCMTQTAPAGWYADPTGRHHYRYWNGTQWTDHVGSHGAQTIDPLPRTDVRSAGAATEQSESRTQPARASEVTGSRPTLWNEQVLVINQRAKLIGSTLTYGVYSQTGVQLATIQELRRDLSAVVSDRMRRRTAGNRERRYQIVDTQGRVLLALTRPEMGWFATKGKLVVNGSAGDPIGLISLESFGIAGSIATAAQAGVNSASALMQRGLGGITGMAAGSAVAGAQRRLDSAVEGLDKMGHARFGLEADGRRVGSIHAEDVKNWDFRVQDPTGNQIARVTKQWAGWTKERFTKADNYIVDMHGPLQSTLRSLIIAGAMMIDAELKQGDPTRGSSLWGTRTYQ